MRRDLGELEPFGDHLIPLGRAHLAADGPVDLGCYLFQTLLERHAFLARKRRVRRHTGEHSPRVDLADLRDVRCLEPKPHLDAPPMALPFHRGEPFPASTPLNITCSAN